MATKEEVAAFFRSNDPDTYKDASDDEIYEFARSKPEMFSRTFGPDDVATPKLSLNPLTMIARGGQALSKAGEGLAESLLKPKPVGPRPLKVGSRDVFSPEGIPETREFKVPMENTPLAFAALMASGYPPQDELEAGLSVLPFASKIAGKAAKPFATKAWRESLKGLANVGNWNAKVISESPLEVMASPPLKEAEKGFGTWLKKNNFPDLESTMKFLGVYDPNSPRLKKFYERVMSDLEVGKEVSSRAVYAARSIVSRMMRSKEADAQAVKILQGYKKGLDNELVKRGYSELLDEFRKLELAHAKDAAKEWLPIFTKSRKADFQRIATALGMVGTGAVTKALGASGAPAAIAPFFSPRASHIIGSSAHFVGKNFPGAAVSSGMFQAGLGSLMRKRPNE